MLMSSKAKACWARLLRPISNMAPPLFGSLVVQIRIGTRPTGRSPTYSTRIVRCLDGHLDVVRMRFAQSGGGDPYEGSPLLELGHRRRSCVEHGLPQAPYQLVGDCGERAAERHVALDALGDQHRVVVHIALEVPVLGVRRAPPARRHGRK